MSLFLCSPDVCRIDRPLPINWKISNAVSSSLAWRWGVAMHNAWRGHGCNRWTARIVWWRIWISWADAGQTYVLRRRQGVSAGWRLRIWSWWRTFYIFCRSFGFAATVRFRSALFFPAMRCFPVLHFQVVERQTICQPVWVCRRILDCAFRTPILPANAFPFSLTWAFTTCSVMDVILATIHSRVFIWKATDSEGFKK